MNYPNILKPLMTVVAIICSFTCWCQARPDDIVGRWINVPKQNLTIEVYKDNVHYYGKIINSDDEQKKPIGFVLLNNLKYDPDSQNWTGGTVKDPNSQRNYSASAQINSESILEVDVYKGLKVFGTTKKFRRVEE